MFLTRSRSRNHASSTSSRRGRTRGTPIGIEGLEPRFALSAASVDPALLPAEVPLEAASLISLRPSVDLNGDTIVDAIWRNATSGISSERCRT
jgi:hypothetical protein